MKTGSAEPIKFTTGSLKAIKANRSDTVEKLKTATKSTKGC